MKSSKKWKREKNNAPDSISITIDPSDDRTETQNPLTEKDLEIRVRPYYSDGPLAEKNRKPCKSFVTQHRGYNFGMVERVEQNLPHISLSGIRSSSPSTTVVNQPARQPLSFLVPNAKSGAIFHLKMWVMRRITAAERTTKSRPNLRPEAM